MRLIDYYRNLPEDSEISGGIPSLDGASIKIGGTSIRPYAAVGGRAHFSSHYSLFGEMPTTESFYSALALAASYASAILAGAKPGETLKAAYMPSSRSVLLRSGEIDFLAVRSPDGCVTLRASKEIDSGTNIFGFIRGVFATFLADAVAREEEEEKILAIVFAGAVEAIESASAFIPELLYINKYVDIIENSESERVLKLDHDKLERAEVERAIKSGSLQPLRPEWGIPPLDGMEGAEAEEEEDHEAYLRRLVYTVDKSAKGGKLIDPRLRGLFGMEMTPYISAPEKFAGYVFDAPAAKRLVLLHRLVKEALDTGETPPIYSFLLYGPPGNGKTTFFEASAAFLGLPFIRVSGNMGTFADTFQGRIKPKDGNLENVPTPFLLGFLNGGFVLIDEIVNIKQDVVLDILSDMTKILEYGVEDKAKHPLCFIGAAYNPGTKSLPASTQSRFGFQELVELPPDDELLEIISGIKKNSNKKAEEEVSLDLPDPPSGKEVEKFAKYLLNFFKKVKAWAETPAVDEKENSESLTVRALKNAVQEYRLGKDLFSVKEILWHCLLNNLDQRNGELHPQLKEIVDLYHEFRY